MKIGYVIGSLMRGGAELQLIRLAEGIVARGHDAHILAYDRPSEHDEVVRRLGVRLTIGGARSRGERLRVVRRWLQGERFDAVHAVLNHVSALTLLARLPTRRPPVVVTDFSSATYSSHRFRARLTLMLYLLADCVVTESERNEESLHRIAPGLRGRVRIIRNGVDLERFAPRERRERRADEAFVFCVVGTVCDVKNPFRTIDAVTELRRAGRTNVRVDWYGRIGMPGEEEEGRRVLAYAAARGVENQVIFHGETADIERAYRGSDAMLHLSLREGFPNVVAEAMASGLPLVLSSVSDLPRVIDAAANGFIVDETDLAAIVAGVERMLDLPPGERSAMGCRSRALATRWFAMTRFIDEFEALYRRLRCGWR